MIVEKHMALGSWQVTLNPNTTPIDALGYPIKYFGHIYILPQRVEEDDFSDAQMKSMARYAGVVRRIDWEDSRKVLSGPGLLSWLGDEQNRGYVYEFERFYIAQDFANTLHRSTGISTMTPTARYFSPAPPGILRHDGQEIETIFSANSLGAPITLTEGVTDGTVTDTFSGHFMLTTPRQALMTVMDAFGTEFRVNPDGTIDCGYEATLFNTSPTSLIVKEGWGDDPNYAGVPAVATRIDANTADLANKVIVSRDLDGTQVGVARIAGDPANYNQPIETYDIRGFRYERTLYINDPPITENEVAWNVAQRWWNEASAIRGNLTITANDYNIEGDFEVGDTVYFYDPESGQYDLTNEVPYRGRIIYPAASKVTGMTWPVTDRMGVYYRSSDATPVWTDITDWVQPDTGNITIEAGWTNPQLMRRKPFESGSVGVRNRHNVPAQVTGLTLSTGSYEVDSGTLEARTLAWVQANWNDVSTNTDGSRVNDRSRYEVQYQPGTQAFTGGYVAGYAGGYAGTNSFSEFATLPDSPWQSLFVPWETGGYLDLPGASGDYAYAPADDIYDITGDIEIIAKVNADVYTGDIAPSTSGTSGTLIAHAGTSTPSTWGYTLDITTTGKLRLLWYDSAVLEYHDSNDFLSDVVSDGEDVWVRATLDADNGASDADVNFYYSTDPRNTVPETWTQLGATVNVGNVTAIDAPSSPQIMEVGSRYGGTNQVLAGRIYRAIVRKGINGGIVFDADFTKVTAGASTFTEASNELATVTIAGSAAVTGGPYALIEALPLDTFYRFRVRAVDWDNNPGQWSDVVTLRSSRDTIAPSKPATPSLVAFRGYVNLTHRLGTAVSSAPFNLEPDLDHLRVYASTTEGFTADEDTLVATTPATVGYIKSARPAVTTFRTETSERVYVRVSAVDRAGNESSLSDEVSIVSLLPDLDSLVPNLLAVDLVQELPTEPDPGKWYYLARDDTSTPGGPYGGDRLWSFSPNGFLALPGASGDAAQTSGGWDSSVITSTFEVVALITPDLWVPSSNGTVVCQYDGSNRTFSFGINSTGYLYLYANDGVSTNFHTSNTATTLFTDAEPGYVRAYWDGADITYWEKLEEDDDWTQLGTADAQASFNSQVKEITVGSQADLSTDLFVGTISWVKVWADGILEFHTDFENAPPQSLFVADQSRHALSLILQGSTFIGGAYAWTEESYPDDRVIASRVVAGAISAGAIRAEHIEAKTIETDHLAGGTLYLGPPDVTDPDYLPGQPTFILNGTMSSGDGRFRIIADDPDDPTITTGVFIENLSGTQLKYGYITLDDPDKDAGPAYIQSSNFGTDEGFKINWDGSAFFRKFVGTGQLRAGGVFLGDLSSAGQGFDSWKGLSLDTLVTGTYPARNFFAAGPGGATMFRAGTNDSYLLYDSTLTNPVQVKGTLTATGGAITGGLTVSGSLSVPNSTNTERVEILGSLGLIRVHNSAGTSGLGGGNRPGSYEFYTDNSFTSRLTSILNLGDRYTYWEAGGNGIHTLSYGATGGILFEVLGRWAGPAVSSWAYGEPAFRIQTHGNADTPLVLNHVGLIKDEKTQLVLEHAPPFADTKSFFLKMLTRNAGGSYTTSTSFAVTQEGAVFLGELSASPPSTVVAGGTGGWLYVDGDVLKFKNNSGTVYTVDVT